MKELIGKTIRGIYVNEDQSVLVFATDMGGVVYETEADCCSETWFADITGVKSLIGATVLAADDVDLPSIEDGRSRQEDDEFYGVKLRTSKGYADIVYRNSSNGYYGGNIYLSSSPTPENLTEITDDWMAQ